MILLTLIAVYLMRTVQVSVNYTAWFLRYENLRSRILKCQSSTSERPLLILR